MEEEVADTTAATDPVNAPASAEQPEVAVDPSATSGANAPQANTDTVAAAPADASAADNDTTSFESVHDYIMHGLESGEKSPTDKPVAEATDTETPNDEPPSPELETEANPEEKPTEEKSEEKDAEEVKAEASDKPYLLTREEIDKQFPRTSKEIRDVAARNAEIALEKQEILDSLGGESYIEPLQMIASGLHGGDNVSVFTGIFTAAGSAGFEGLVRDVLQLAFVDAVENEPKTEWEMQLNEALQSYVDTALAARLGDGVNMRYITKLVKYDRSGQLNTADVDQYFEETGEDVDVIESPRIAALEQENRHLKEKLGQTSESQATAAKKADEEHREQYDTGFADNLTAMAKSKIFSKSVLREIDGDSAELKIAKGRARKMLLEGAIKESRDKSVYRKLRNSDRKGEKATAKYRKDLTTLIDDALAQVKIDASDLEPVFSLVYSLSRNTNLKKPQLGNGAPPENADKARQPTQPKQAQRSEDISWEDWQKHLREQTASMEASA